MLTKNKVKILFQHTKDKRVLDFLKKKNFEVIEIKENDRYNISPNINIQIILVGQLHKSFLIALKCIPPASIVYDQTDSKVKNYFKWDF